jgi:hypothetical protein
MVVDEETAVEADATFITVSGDRFGASPEMASSD